MVDWEEFYNSFRKPDFIPGYEIQNHLGGGAFGEVYKTRKHSIGKAYAVKFLRLDEDTNREAIERELEQVRLFASIDHPNLVTMEDMGVVHGIPYLIMGYAGEDTLARRLKQGDLDADGVLRYFVQACRGVVALHDRRLAHFDLKPGNIFIKGDVARVGDYGLAKLLTEGRQTLSFGRGTPHYMAPEMLRNRADHRADIYSLGVILYEGLTGRLPYENPSSSGVITRETDTPPEFPADFPAAYRSVVERCLRLDPDDRFDSVHDLLVALGQTSRQGDSVILSWGSEGPPAARSAASEPRSATLAAEATNEIKVAAAELARGAVGVARGVWDGVVGRSDSEQPAEDGSDELPGTDIGTDVVSFQSLEAEAEAEERSRVAAVRAPAGGTPPGFLLSAPYGPGSAGGTVPVPPRTEGGVFGTLMASLALGAEILGALVTGPVLVVVRGVGGLADRFLRGVPGLLGGLLRFSLFLVVLTLLGGLAAFLVLLVVTLQT